MEIDQLTVTSISLTLRTKTFLCESDDLVPLDTPIIVFLDSVTVTESHSLSRTISSTIDLSFIYVVIAPCINIKYNLDAKEG